MAYETDNTKEFAEFDHVIVKEEEDGGWTVRKANNHKIGGFGHKQTATGHAAGIANTYEVRELEA